LLNLVKSILLTSQDRCLCHVTSVRYCFYCIRNNLRSECAIYYSR